MKTILFACLVYFFINPLPANKIQNTKWVLLKVVETNKTQFADPTCNIYISFDSLGNYSGHSGWNNFKGNYSLKSSEDIGMTSPSRTKKGGEKKCLLGESLYPYFVKTVKFNIKKDTLILSTFDNIQLYYLKK